MSQLNNYTIRVDVLKQCTRDGQSLPHTYNFKFLDEDHLVNGSDMHLENCKKFFYLMMSKDRGILLAAPSWEIAMRHLFCLALENEKVMTELKRSSSINVIDISSFNIRSRDTAIRDKLYFASCLDPENGDVVKVKYKDLFESIGLKQLDRPHILGTVVSPSLTIVPRNEV